MAETKINSDFLDGIALRKLLEAELPKSKKSVRFISAYITQSGIDWLCKSIPDNIDCEVVCRLLPSDVLSRASQLSALKTALVYGMKIYCLHALHAKIYSIDNVTIYAGSTNLTSNGLIIYGAGNLEANVQVAATKDNLNFIDKIITSATQLDEESLTKMQSCIDLKEKEIFLDQWPEGVIHEDEGIWVRDFFWGQPRANQISQEQIHDLEIMGIETFDQDNIFLQKQFSKVRCVRWLIRTLREKEGSELFFGALTQKLHDDLIDDPTPYRKDVKFLIQNMLSYCEIYMQDRIEISRPNYSQKIKLRT